MEHTTKITFAVKMSPLPYIGQFMRAADLCDCVCLSVPTLFEVEWKAGEIVNKKRIDKAAQTIKKALEDQHYDCYSIKPFTQNIA